MIGGQAVVIGVHENDLEVDYQGEIWRAISAQPLRQGQQVTIEAIEGLSLRVVPSRVEKRTVE